METATKFAHFVFLLLLCSLLPPLHQTSDCYSGNACIYADAANSHEIHNRKVLYVLGGKKVVFYVHGSTRDNELGQNLDKWEELRRVPSGPDPLHHNGAGPRKPKTSP